MANNLRNWTLKDYDTQQWTEIVRAPAVIRTIIIVNNNTAPVSASLRLSHGPGTDSSSLRATILPLTEIEAGSAQVIDVSQLNLGRQDVLQARMSDTQVQITVSGEDMS